MTDRSLYISDGRIEKEIMHKAKSEKEARPATTNDAKKDITSKEKAR